jgi:hypothetical protein
MTTRGRKPGLPKTGGRKKGTPNKVTANFRETLDVMEFNVCEEAIKFFRDPEVPPEVRFRLLDLIATYSQQKPKPIDILPPPDDFSDVDPNEAMKALKNGN